MTSLILRGFKVLMPLVPQKGITPFRTEMPSILLRDIIFEMRNVLLNNLIRLQLYLLVNVWLFELLLVLWPSNK